MVAVVAGNGGIAPPSIGIGRTREPGDREVERVARCAGHTEMEPLIEIRFAVLADRKPGGGAGERLHDRSEEHTSELQSLMRISYAVFCLKKKTTKTITPQHTQHQINN